MPWYIPVLSAVIGALVGWWVRARYDQKAALRERYKNTLNSFLSLTDAKKEADINYLLWALIRVGSLRLSPQDFECLLGDIQKHGIKIDASPYSDEIGLRAFLIYAVHLGYETKSSEDVVRFMMLKRAEAADAQESWSCAEAERIWKKSARRIALC